MTAERNVTIGRDANDNVIITGDGNVVIVQTTSLLEVATAAPVAWREIGPNPYRGLEVFREEHADRFFGREALTDKLWMIFRDLHQAPANGPVPLRLLPIIGPSGSGKSSVARAGLIAELARRPLPGRSEARVGVITPGSHPIEALALVLARIATGDQTPVTKTAEFTQRLRCPAASGEFDGLRFIADLLPEVAAKPLILMVDQFEESYSLCDDAADRDAFIGNLLHAAGAAAARVSIIATLRSDFLGATNRHPKLSQALAQGGVLVPVMSEGELRRAIGQPAVDAGHPIDPGTVELLLADTAGREGALPLLQFALTCVWDGMANGIAPAQTVKDLGGVGGALAKEAQQLYDSLSDVDKRIARRAFLAMVRLGEGTLDTRRRAAVPEIVGQGENPGHVMAVLRVFSQPDRRLVTLSAEADAIVTAEVTHEALLEDWGLVRDWLIAGRDDIRFHRRLAEAAEHWNEHGRAKGLLWRPPDLDLLRKYEERASSDMTSMQVAFFAASKQQHQRTRTLRRIAITGLAALAIIAAGVAIYADQQRLMANWERNRALATQSLFLTNVSERETTAGNATNGILLALEGLPSNLSSPNRPHVPEAQLALYFGVHELRERIVLSGHVDTVQSAAFSPDGKRVLTVSEKVARLWDVASGQSVALLSGHEAEVHSAVFSPDGKRVATASYDKSVRLWDAANGRNLAVLNGHKDRVRTAAFSPDGLRIVTASDDKTGRLWDFASGHSLAVLNGHEDKVVLAAFSPDGRRVITASHDKTARLWDVATGRVLAVFTGHVGPVVSAAFSTDGRRVVTASYDRTARLWDAASGQILATLEGHEEAVMLAALGPDGERVVTASLDSTARLWDAASGRNLAVLKGHEGWVLSAAFSPDGKQVVTASYDATVRLWDAASGKSLDVLRGHEHAVNSAAFSPDGKRLVSASSDRSARLWDTASAQSYAALKAHVSPVLSAAFSADGSRVVTASDDKTARLWDAASGQSVAVLEGHEDAVMSAAFSPSGRRVVTASDDKTARLWDAASGQSVAVLKGHEDKVVSAAFSPDEKRVVTASDDQTARLWDVTTSQVLAVLKGHLAPVESAAFSPDGKQVVTASYDATARLWDAASGQILAVLSGHVGPVLSAAFSPDGKRVVTASYDQTARLWDASTGKSLAVLSGHQGLVWSAAFSPDGKRVVTASDDKTARLWDVASRRPLAELKGHERRVVSAAFSPDGKLVVTASHDKTARLWVVLPEGQALIDYAKSIVPRQLTSAQRKQFFLEPN